MIQNISLERLNNEGAKRWGLKWMFANEAAVTACRVNGLDPQPHKKAIMAAVFGVLLVGETGRAIDGFRVTSLEEPTEVPA